jgi:alpha-glucuronidase
MFKWRVIEPWHEPDGVTFFGHAGNIFTIKDMLKTEPSSPLGRYVKQVRDWGFNHIVSRGEPTQDTEAWRNFAHYLKELGIGMIIYREWCETERGRSWPISQSEGHQRTSEKLCPYSEATRAYWKDRIESDYKMIPDLAGYRLRGTEFYFANGAPWMCGCETCRTMTKRERTRDAIRLIAGLLGKHGGMLFWESVQDDPWGQRQEADYFKDMTGAIPENAMIFIKYFYWDFHPGWPRHPLYDTIKKDKQGRSPFMTSIQQPGEYRGVHDFPWCMVDEWKGTFREMARTGQQGLWVMAIVHPDGWDHLLNMVNWYAIERYMKNPNADPAELKMDWARERFGQEAATTVVNVLNKITKAADYMYFFDTCWTSNHSRFPTLEYLDSHLCGPHRQTKRIDGTMGMEFPLDMYSPERAMEIKARKSSRMSFDRFAITTQLKAEAVAQKNEAIRLVEETIDLWQSLESKMDDKTYKKILSGLKGNRDDTKIFSLMMDMYMDWKLGVLTEKRIDEILESCDGLKGVVLPEPLDAEPNLVTIVEAASLKTFAEKIRRDLREPWIEDYWKKHTLGAGVIEPLTDPKTGEQWNDVFRNT